MPKSKLEPVEEQSDNCEPSISHKAPLSSEESNKERTDEQTDREKKMLIEELTKAIKQAVDINELLQERVVEL